ncbi:hypothetical protein LSH36_215g01040 [Paralvinella palmiformis]|uniref:Uncharacterized protein n=1 Tax=Paralvinella palmiformis TaxID=53620 RepID=A0AAD9JNL6_9ANNE|nr:hypothetical protein LSH36_215g01040 [Paralvinella palmiformis]
MEQNEINDKMELRTEAPFRDQNSREHFFDAVENLAVSSRYEKLDVQELTVNEAEVTCYNNEMEQNEINDKMELRTEAPFRDQNSREHFFDAVENLAVSSRYEKLVVNPAETVPRDATDCDRIGRVFTYRKVTPSEKKVVPNGEREGRVILVKKSSQPLAGMWNPIQSVSEIIATVIIVTILTPLSIMYAAYRCCSWLQTSLVLPSFRGHTAGSGGRPISLLPSWSLHAIKTNIETILFMVFAPVTIPCMIFKKIFTRETFIQFMPFFEIFVLIYRLLKRIPLRRR